MNEQQRIAVVRDVLSNLIDQGLTHAQIKLAVHAIAEAAVAMTPEQLALSMQPHDDKASLQKLANAGPAPAAASMLAMLATQIAGWGGNRLGRVTDAVTSFGIRTAPAIALGAPLALAGGAYLTGKGFAEMAGDDASQIKEIQHQEMVAALRRNAEKYKRHTKGNEDASATAR